MGSAIAKNIHVYSISDKVNECEDKWPRGALSFITGYLVEKYSFTCVPICLVRVLSACHPYVIRMSFVCHSYVIRMSFVCHSYVIRIRKLCVFSMIATCSYYKIQIIYEYRHTEMVILFYYKNDTSQSRMAYGKKSNALILHTHHMCIGYHIFKISRKFKKVGAKYSALLGPLLYYRVTCLIDACDMLE